METIGPLLPVTKILASHHLDYSFLQSIVFKHSNVICVIKLTCPLDLSFIQVITP